MTYLYFFAAYITLCLLLNDHSCTGHAVMNSNTINKIKCISFINIVFIENVQEQVTTKHFSQRQNYNSFFSTKTQLNLANIYWITGVGCCIDKNKKRIATINCKIQKIL